MLASIFKIFDWGSQTISVYFTSIKFCMGYIYVDLVYFIGAFLIYVLLVKIFLLNIFKIFGGELWCMRLLAPRFELFWCFRTSWNLRSWEHSKMIVLSNCPGQARRRPVGRESDPA